MAQDETPEDLMNQLRQKMQDRGTEGTAALARTFRQADDNGNMKLDYDDYEEVLSYCGLHMSQAATKKLFRYFDKDGSGQISLSEFYVAFKGDLNARRTAIVTAAFNSVDRDGSGVLTVSDIADLYDCSKHPAVQKAEITEEECLQRFLDGFDGACGNGDGQVTMAEWTDYYTDIAATITSDDYFVTVVEGAWGIKEQDTWVEDQLNNFKAIISEKCRQKCKEGSSISGKAKSILKFFDEDDSDHVTKQEFGKAMMQVGLPDLSPKVIDLIFGVIDTNKDGKLSINEFASYFCGSD